MLPAFSYMDPYQRNNIPYTPHYHPRWDVFPPQMKIDPTKPPVTSEPLPYNGNFVFSNPAEFHGCCSHGHHPGYYSYGPQHFYPAPVSPVYNHGPFPSHPENYHAYFVPPPHYSMEHPRYDFDKSKPGYHCCGCSNHTHSQMPSNNVKIEEHEPEVGKKDSDSLNPIKLMNYPYPIVWIPPGYMKDKEGGIPSELEQKSQNGWFPLDMNRIRSLKHSEDDKRDQNQRNEEQQSLMAVGLEPMVWDGLFPLGMKGARTSNNGEGEKRIQDQKSEDKKAEWTLPMPWIPAYDKPKEGVQEDVGEINEDPKLDEEKPSKLKIIPVKPLKQGVVADSSGSGDHPKMMGEVIPRSIPVKQMGECEEKKSPKDIENKLKDNPVKQIEEKGEKSSSNIIRRMQSLSPPKASKLPPVCLRIDPLPRRKNGNGTSRSPSPPGVKAKTQEEPQGTLKSFSPRGMKDEVLHDSTLSKVEEVWPDQSKKVDVRNHIPAQISVTVPVVPNEEVLEKPATEKVEMGENKHSVPVVPNEDKKSEEASEAIHLSSIEAAVLIQSAYRGFEVRKQEPLKKLRQIASVREQVAEIRNHISGLESSSELWNDEKKIVVTNETIMNLLLQLDTIQGLHSSLREIRKSVAKELVFLQDKLDSLTNQKLEGPKSAEAEEVPVINLAMLNPCSAYDKECMLLGPNDEQKESEPTKDLCETTQDSDSEKDVSCTPKVGEFVEKVHDKECVLMGTNNEHKESEPAKDLRETTLDSISEKDVSCASKVGESVEPNAQADIQVRFSKQPEVGSEVELKAADLMELLPMVKPKDEVKDEEYDETTELRVEFQKAEHVPEFGLEESIELPVVVDEKDALELEEHMGLSTEDKFKDSGFETNFAMLGVSKSLPIGTDQSLVHEAVDSTAMVDQEMDRLVELPLGVLDEETPNSTSEEDIKLSRKVEEPLLQARGAESKPEELQVLPLQKEERQTKVHLEVSQPEEAQPFLLVEKESLVEEPIETSVNSGLVQELIETSVDSCGTLLSELRDNVGASLDLDVNIEKTKEDRKPEVEAEVPKLGEPIVGKSTDQILPSLEASDGASIELENEESEESDKAEIKPCVSEVVEMGMSSVADDKGYCSWVTVDEAEMGKQCHEKHGEEFPEVGKNNKKPYIENDKLKEMLEMLMEAGRQQLNVLSDLNERVRELETKSSRKKKLKMRRQRAAARCFPSKLSNDLGTM